MTFKSLILAGAALAACGTAAAQSSVTIYGRVDLGFRHDSDPAASRNQVANGSMNAVGFRGVEDLAAGLQAFFQLEHRLEADVGTAHTPFWDEISIVGVRGGFGQVTLGRQGGPYGVATDPDAFGGDTVGGRGERKAGADDKYNNSVVYWSPTMSGFSAGVGTSLGEGVQGRGTSAALKYASGPILAAVSYADRANDDRAYAVGGTYDFEAAKLFAGIARNDGKASGVERKTADFGVVVPVGAGSVRAKFNNDDINGTKTKNLGVGYWHDLSKRTMLYADYGNQNTDGVSRINRFDTGIRHNF